MAPFPEPRRFDPAGWFLARWKLRRCTVRGTARVRGRIWVHGRGTIRLGDGVFLDGAHHPIELHALEPDSEIVIGDGVQVQGGASIEAVSSVTVGPRTRIGGFARLMDNHFHPLVGDRHVRPPSAPVVVGADVQIGPQALLLAGSRVGDGAKVRGGTVLTRRMPVPAGRTASGFPPVIE
ncbi:MAG TPA: acetyltransferase [Myxococcales bacterium]|nr:acetyltransferase [Myxococcales bacterium]